MKTDRFFFGLLILITGFMFLFVDIGQVLHRFINFFAVILFASLLFRSIKARSFLTASITGVILYLLIAKHIYWLPSVSILTALLFIIFTCVGLSILFPKKGMEFLSYKINSGEKYYSNSPKNMYITPNGETTEAISVTSSELNIHINQTMINNNTLTLNFNATRTNITLSVPKNYVITTYLLETPMSTLDFSETSLNDSFKENTLILTGLLKSSNIKTKFI